MKSSQNHAWQWKPLCIRMLSATSTIGLHQTWLKNLLSMKLTVEEGQHQGWLISQLYCFALLYTELNPIRVLGFLLEIRPHTCHLHPAGERGPLCIWRIFPINLIGPRWVKCPALNHLPRECCALIGLGCLNLWQEWVE